MKSSLVLLFFTVIASSVYAISQNITVSLPNGDSVWRFGNVEKIQWSTERTGNDRASLVSYLIFFFYVIL